MSEPVLITFKDPDTFRVACGPRDTDLAKSVPGMTARKPYVQSGEVEWTCPATWYHANILRAVFRDRLVYGSELVAWGVEQMEAERFRLSQAYLIPDPISAMLSTWPE